MVLTDRERAEKLAEKLSSEVYSGGRGFEGYGSNSEHLQRGAPQMGSAMVSIPPAHPPTPDLSPAPTTPAMWNTKMNKAGTVSTPEGEYDLRLVFFFRLISFFFSPGDSRPILHRPTNDLALPKDRTGRTSSLKIF